MKQNNSTSMITHTTHAGIQRAGHSKALRAKLALTMALLCIGSWALAQQLVTTAATNNAQVQALANLLRNTKGGVSVSNITWSAYGSGVGHSGSAIGSFSASAPFQTITNGVILSTGKINDIQGPNYLAATGSDLAAAGDADISMMLNGPTRDAAVLEFDVVASGSTLSLDYIFASEEYPEKVCAPLTDAFAIYISGPGIAGRLNMATVPGFPGVPVGINTVNSGIGNAPGVAAANCPLNYAAAYLDNPIAASGNAILQYDGLTTILQASATVQPCQTYHIKIVIADGGDGLYDSGILLKAGSLVSEALTITTQGSTQICQGQTLALSVPEGYHYYQWKKDGSPISGATAATYTANAPGVYTVDVKKQSCSPILTSADLTITWKATIQPNINASGLNLCASPAGVTLTAAHPTGTYTWTPGNTTTRTITATTPGTYSVQVIDNGCSATYSAIVRGNTMTIQTDSIGHVTCFDGKDGKIIISVVDKASTFTYQWAKEASPFTSSLEDLCCLKAGVYTVTVTDADGCVKTKTEEVLQPTELLVSATQIAGTGGSVDATVSGSVPPYTYRWTNSVGQQVATTEDLESMPQGTYTLTVTDSKNCAKSTTVNIVGGCSGTANTVITPASCLSEANGGIVLTVSGLTGTLTYGWQGPDNFSSTAPAIAGLKVGTYTYTVVNGQQCKVSGTAVVTAPTYTATVTATNPPCYAAATGSAGVTIAGGTTPYTYLWRDAAQQTVATTPSTGAILPAGTYTIEVTDQTGCIVTNTVTLTQPEAFTASLTPTNATCYNLATGAIATTVAGGTLPYTYAWSVQQGSFTSTAAQLANIKAGVYTLVLTDSKGCTPAYSPSNEITVTEPPQMVGVVTPSSQVGQATASITSGGLAPFTYLWSNQATTDTVKGLKQNVSYTVTITGQDGCSTLVNYTPANGCNASATLTAVANMTCFGTNNGSIDIAMANAAAPITYSWTGPNGYTATTEDIANLAHGIYQLAATDANGCKATATAQVLRPLQLTLALTETQITCFGAANGSVNATVAGGTPGVSGGGLYSLAWKKDGSPFATTQNIASLTPAVYELTVTDAKGCTAVAAKTIAQPALLTASNTKTNITCLGNTDGTITTSISGGTTPYTTYSWTKQGGGFTATTPSLTALTAGTYTLTITDAKGCTTSTSATIEAPPSALTLALDSKTDATCAGATNGSAQITAAGGYGSITYAWKLFGNTIAATGTQEDQTALRAGTYTVFATDAGGCVKSQDVTIAEPQAPAITLSGPASVCEGQTITLASSQTANTYQWLLNNQASPVATTATYAVTTAAQSGFYTLTLVKANGCTETTAPVQITINPIPVATITPSRTNFCVGSQVQLVANSYPGATYGWTYNGSPIATPNPPQTLSVTNAGTYALTITTPLCATSQASVTLTAYPLFTVNTAITNATCSPSNNGAIAATASGAFGTVTWDWAHLPGSADPATVTGLSDGFYTVTATDAAGCNVVKQATVTDTELNVLSTLTNLSCTDQANGSINLNVSYVSPTVIGNCYSDVPTSAFTCGSGCTPLSGSNYTNINTGESFCVQAAQTFTGGINMNGGTLVVCGTIDLRTSGQSLNLNNGTLVINPGGKILTNAWMTINTNVMFKNYGEFTAQGLGVQNNNFENYGSITIANALQVNNGGKLTNYSTITATSLENNSGAAGFIKNYGTLAISGNVSANNASPTENYCTINAGSMAINGGSILNTKIINVSGLTSVNWGSTLTQQAGARLETGSLQMNGGAVTTAGSSCSSIKINGATTINWGSTFSGQTGLCPSQTIVNNFGPQAFGAQVTTNCSCTANGSSQPVSCAVQWSGPGISSGTTGTTLSNLAAGTYTASITCGPCTRQYSYTITQPPALNASVAQLFKPSCFGLTNGGINVDVSGGTPFTGPSQAPYTYTWAAISGPSLSASSEDVSNIGAGTYSLVVKDKNNCTFTLSPITLTQPALLTASVECSGGPSCRDAENGSAYANIAGGTQPFTFIWTKQGNNTPLPSPAGYSIGGLAAGTYQLLVKDANNCEATASVVVPVATNDCITGCTLALTLTGQEASCPENPDGVLTAQVSGATGTTTYDWSHIVGTNDGTEPGYVAPGTYSLKVTDAKGCNVQQQVTISSVATSCNLPTLCSLRVENTVKHPSCPGYTDGAITLQIFGANGATSMEWDDLSGTANPTNRTALAPGLYSGLLTDSKGCSVPVRLSILAKPTHAIYASAQVVCPTAPITLTSSYSSGNTWSTGDTTQAITVAAPGTYTVSTLLPGCPITLTKQITVVAGNCTTVNPSCAPEPEEEVFITDNCKEDELTIAFSNAYERYFDYIDDLKENFRRQYIERCLNAKETFTARYDDTEHHYTLYYYDQAGNLVRTVPPHGVTTLSPSQTTAAKQDYENNTRNVYTDHTLTSTYTYNSLNQLIAQNIPDHDPMEVTGTTNGSTGLDNTYKISATHFPQNGNNGFVLAYDANNDGKIYFTNNNGKTWSELSTVSTEDILDVHRITDLELHAVGRKGTHIASTDGGKRWILRETGIATDLIKVHFSSVNTGILIDRLGRSYQTTDGGISWTLASGSATLQSLIGNALITDLSFHTYPTVFASASTASSGLLFTSTDGGFTWSSIQAITNTAPIISTSMPSEAITIAATNANYLLATANGASWKTTSLTAGPAYQGIHDRLRFRSATQGVRQNSLNGDILATTDGGATWNTSFQAALLTYFHPQPSNIGYVTKAGKIYRTDNGGFGPSWPLASTNLPPNQTLAISATPNDAYIASTDGATIKIRPTNLDPAQLYTWQSIFTYYPISDEFIINFKIDNDLNGIIRLSDGSIRRFTGNATNGIGASLPNQIDNLDYALLANTSSPLHYMAYKLSGQYIYTTDGGINWTSGNLPSAGAPYAALSAIFSSNKLMASIADASGKLYRNDDLTGTGTWQSAISNLTPPPLRALAVAPTAAIALGNGRLAITSTDAGNTWTIKNISTTLPLSTSFTDAAILHGTYHLGTSSGAILSSPDATSWTTNTLSQPTSAPVRHITANPTNTRSLALFANGTIFYKNSATDLSWSRITPNAVADPLYDAEFTSTGAIIIVGGSGKVLHSEASPLTPANVTNTDAPVLYASIMTSPAIGYAAGKNGVVVKTTSGGDKWQELNSSTQKDLYALDFIDAQKGIIAGDATIRITTNGGADNFAQLAVTTTPASLTGYTFRDAQFVDPTNIIVVGGLGAVGKAFISSNGGASFTLLPDNFPNPLYAVEFFNNTQGLAASRETELYKITRAGASYTFTPVAIPTSLLSGRSIRNIHMASPSVWYLVGTGGLMLRTDNAGTNWINVNNTNTTADLTFINTRPDGYLSIGGSAGTLLYLNDERSRFTDKFYYDELGRLVLSQNSKQNNFSPQKGYSYTLYDVLGRITEVGELLTNADPREVINNVEASQINYKKFSEDFLYKQGNKRRQITRTYYDVAKFTLPSFTQAELRNRVASITYLSGEDALDPTFYDHATHYSYDVHGNVKTLLQDNAALARTYPTLADQRYKKVDYTYDLISGNVHTVAFQKGLDDQFYHKYEYDADNRITNVYTSRDATLWEQDAKYFYYRHGPLARTEIGDRKIQAADYAYTLQGWIKGVNANNLAVANDPGKDALANTRHRYIAADAAAYSLHYYAGDYKSIANINPQAQFYTSPSGSIANTQAGANLYNGNISSMATTILGTPAAGNTLPLTPQGLVAQPQVTTYRYDQLNRIKELKAYKDINTATNTWNAAAPSTAYAETFAYDPGGNITKLTRNDHSGTAMDDMEYYYENISKGFKRNTNRLRAVNDLVTNNAAANLGDIQHGQVLNAQSPELSNYHYDAIGNLVKDASEQIENIEWNVYGKVQKVTRTATSSKPDLEFLYDASGNRIAKIVKPAATKTDAATYTTTWYTRDAQGNTLATYEQKPGANSADPAQYYPEEYTLYGSSRLGTRQADKTITATQILGSGSTINTTPPPYLPQPTDIIIDDNDAIYTLNPGQRGVIPANTTFTGKIIQNGGSLLVLGTYSFSPLNSVTKFTYNKGDITVIGIVNGFYFDHNPALAGPGNIYNYGQWSIFGAGYHSGVKFYNYSNYFTNFFTLESGSEFYNYKSIRATQATIKTGAKLIMGPAAIADFFQGFTLQTGATLEGSFENYSSIISRQSLTLEQGSMIRGLLKICNASTQASAFVSATDIPNTVVLDCAFEVAEPKNRIATSYSTKVGLKAYEMSNHLGNVLTTVSDRRIGVSLAGNPTLTAYYTAVILSSSDYYSFGSTMTGRGYKGDDSYRYGFNGKEDDDETGWQDYGMRMYDPRLGRFFTVDPITKKYPHLTSYQFASNSPVWMIDLDGLEGVKVTNLQAKKLLDGTYEITGKMQITFKVLNLSSKDDFEVNGSKLQESIADHISTNIGANTISYSLDVGKDGKYIQTKAQFNFDVSVTFDDVNTVDEIKDNDFAIVAVDQLNDEFKDQFGHIHKTGAHVVKKAVAFIPASFFNDPKTNNLYLHEIYHILGLDDIEHGKYIDNLMYHLNGGVNSNKLMQSQKRIAQQHLLNNSKVYDLKKSPTFTNKNIGTKNVLKEALSNTTRYKFNQQKAKKAKVGG